jgi:NTE family protein
MRLVLIITLLIGFSTNKSNAQKAQLENLVFEGAGIRGLAYAGAIKVLESENVLPKIKKVGGTSAGAITAALLSVGYNSTEIYSIIASTEFNKFNDGKMGPIGGVARMKNNYGWYKGNALVKWLEDLVYAKTKDANITFAGLQKAGYKDLYITATCLNQQRMIVLSAESYPNMRIVDAVRASMSIPLYYGAVFVDKDGRIYETNNAENNLDVLVDGGVVANFPIQIFDTIINGKRVINTKTIGVRIDSKEQIEQDKTKPILKLQNIKNMEDYMQAFYIFVLENLNRNLLTDEDWNRTISVSDANIGPKVKHLSTSQKNALVASGESYTKEFLKTIPLH